MARKAGYIKNDDRKEVIVVVDKELTKAETVIVKNLINIGYEVIQAKYEDVYPAEKIFTKENIEAFLATKDKEVIKKFDDEKNAPAFNKDGSPKLNKKGEQRVRGFVGALRWFRAEYEEEFKTFIEKK